MADWKWLHGQIEDYAEMRSTWDRVVRFALLRIESFWPASDLRRSMGDLLAKDIHYNNE
jgi:hypothetical protein